MKAKDIQPNKKRAFMTFPKMEFLPSITLCKLCDNDLCDWENCRPLILNLIDVCFSLF